MSKQHKQMGKKITIPRIGEKYLAGEKITMVTCYDAAFGKIINSSAIDMVLVGDSLGNVVLGLENTIGVTMEHMVHHCRAVSRSVNRPLIVGDLPFLSYHLSKSQCLENAGRLMQEGGCEAVKMEGGKQIEEQIECLASAGIPTIGHIGLMPQHLHAQGGYWVQGRGHAAGKKLVEDAKRLADAGCFCLVLELVPQSLAAEITKEISIPTIGIGAGGQTSGQVLVLHDLLGFDSKFQPKFLKHYAKLGDIVSEALAEYVNEVQSGCFPSDQHCFD